jgi:hypothetical protein
MPSGSCLSPLGCFLLDSVDKRADRWARLVEDAFVPMLPYDRIIQGVSKVTEARPLYIFLRGALPHVEPPIHSVDGGLQVMHSHDRISCQICLGKGALKDEGGALSPAPGRREVPSGVAVDRGMQGDQPPSSGPNWPPSESTSHVDVPSSSK